MTTPLLGVLTTHADNRAGDIVDEARTHGLPVVYDSGAWSVFTGSATIDVDDHATYVRDHQREGVRYVGLDVINNPEASYANWTRQRALGAPVEPTIHYGDDPALIDRYLADGLATPWVNLGGLVESTSRPSVHRNLAAWCAAVAVRCPTGTAFHGLGCTPPEPNRLFPFDAIDSTYWLSPVRWHRTLPLFDPTIGRWRIMRASTRHPTGRVETWTKAHRHGRMLRDHYGVEPEYIWDATDLDLTALTTRSHALFARHYRARHGSSLTVYLAGASTQHYRTIQRENACAESSVS